MRKKTGAILFGIFLMCMMLSACGQEELLGPINTYTLEIAGDGSIVEYQVDDFDKAYYNVSELERMAKDEIEQYNNNTPKPVSDSTKPLVSVKQASLLEENAQKVCLALEFQSVQAMKDYYASLEETKNIFYGTVSEAITKGYSVADNLMQDKGNPVSEQQLDKAMSKQILILGEGTRVRFDGEILYKSSNIIGNKKGEVSTTPGQLNYIVFK